MSRMEIAESSKNTTPFSTITSKFQEMREMFSSILEKLYHEEESMPFRESIISLQVGTSQSFETNESIDLSVIKKKLETNYYAEPWNFVNDVWIMFENAWLYNQKSSKIYKCCSILAEIFKQEINQCMRTLGYCCGHRYVFDPPTLHCCSRKSCVIPKNQKYYSHQNECYVFCVKCFTESQNDSLSVMDDADQNRITLKKSSFVERKNNRIEPEPFVKCYKCEKKFHQICMLHIERSRSPPINFICSICQPNGKNDTREINEKSTAKRLRTTKLSDHIQKRVHNYLKSKNIETGEVTVRVVSSFKKSVQVKQEMKKRFVSQGKFPEKFPYTAKALLVFQNIEEVDVCIFGMHVQEYDSDCPSPNTRRVYISYLDSVNYFSPKQFRGDVYHEIILGYLDYLKRLGYTDVHVWACPPPEGDDYIFYKHPDDQKLPDHKRLDDWYRKLLSKGIAESIILANENIFNEISNELLLPILKLPYFENDFWPSILEENLKIIDIKEQQRIEKKKIESNCMAENRDTITNKSHFEEELSTLIRTAYRKHKEVFFIFRLCDDQPGWIVSDPDPLINCKFMDGRDNFLLLAREEHLEFSTLRRAKYSSMVLLYELLHSRNEEKFDYICNICKCYIETRYHCTICLDFDLCAVCWKEKNHPHEMHILKTNESDKSLEQPNEPAKSIELKNNSIESCIDALTHACLCRDKNCNLSGCLRMKRILSHFKVCNVKGNNNCLICKQLTTVCWYHAKRCQEKNCVIPPCASIKSKLRVINSK